MKKSYLIVFEKSSNAWGAIAPDAAGTFGLGDTVDEARESLREGLGYLLQDAVERNLPIPEQTSTKIDFSEFDPLPSETQYPLPSETQYIVEWLTVELPEISLRPHDHAQQAA